MRSKNVEKLVTSATMIALATVLSMVKIWEMPMGGSITLFSMLPICVVGYKYGMKHGLFTGFIYGLLQLIMGTSGLKGLSFATVTGAIFLDYLIAFSVLGFGGLFRNSKKMSQSVSLAIGCGIAGFLRFICHFVSGYLLWAIWADKVGWAAVVYSFQYNISYMGFEIVLTVIAASILGASIPKNILIGNSK